MDIAKVVERSLAAEERRPVVGEAVFYQDALHRLHNAIITAVWSSIAVNVVVVSMDENKTDNYGRQIERYTSVTKGSVHGAPGNYWHFIEDAPNEPSIPVQS